MLINPDPELMQIFDFTEADLEVNRAGRMSERQVQKLSEKVKKERLSQVLGAIVICVLMLFIIMSNFFSQTDSYRIEYWVFIALFLLVLVLLRNYVAAKSLASDVKSGTVRSAQGVIKRWQDRGGGTLKIANEWLDIDQIENTGLKVYLQKIPKGTQFRVNYAPKINKVLSMEIIDS